MPTGTIIIHENEIDVKSNIVIYARVSNYERKESLDTQIYKR